jgi:amino acid permease
MRLKSAAFLALLGTALTTLVLLVRFIENLLALNFIAPTTFLASFIEAFAGVTVVIFLYTFYRAQP